MPDAFQQHAAYAQLARTADDAHASGRKPLGITRRQIDLARLYSYAFRGHTIGAFHATRVGLEALPAASTLAMAHRNRAVELLSDLADMAMDLVADDTRALLLTFHHYDRGCRRVAAALQNDADASGDANVATIRQRFIDAVNRISSCNGVYLARDDEAPQQASFIVPGLGITIVPLIYGDYHSWNLAWLTPEHRDVPRHQHDEAAEIHIGYQPIAGATILGDNAADVPEGYAMPIPPGTPHGYRNPTDIDHHVPFIYGSLKAGGWGVFFDVEPKPFEPGDLSTVPLRSATMNESVWLEQLIAEAEAAHSARRFCCLRGELTDRNGSGGLELAVCRVTPGGVAMPNDSYRIVSVVRGRGRVMLGDEIEQDLQPHEHFGVPAGMTLKLWQSGDEPMVTLDAVIRPNPTETDGRLRSVRSL